MEAIKQVLTKLKALLKQRLGYESEESRLHDTYRNR
jgi:hypothetical protein